MNQIIKVCTILSLCFFVSGNSSSLTFANGSIRTPTALFYDEGYISYNHANYDPFQSFRISLSPYNWLEGSFFYRDMNTIRYAGLIQNQSNKDKGFAIKLKIIEQDRFIPNLAIGFEDVAGTSLFSSEYLVGTWDTPSKNIQASLGIGWGRLGSLGNIENPFIFLSESFKSRKAWKFTSSDYGGVPLLSNYFSGTAGLFGSLHYKLNHKTTLKLELDSNNFSSQRGYNALESSRWNYGISYKPLSFLEIGLNHQEGNDTSFNLFFSRNFSLFQDYEIKSQKNTKNQTILDKNKFYEEELKIQSENGVLIQNMSLDTQSKTLDIKYAQLIDNNEKFFAKKLHEYYVSESSEIENINAVPINGRVTLSTYSYKKDGEEIVSKSHSSPKKTYEFNPKVIYPVFTNYISPGFKSHIGSPSGFVFGEIYLGLNTSSVINEKFEFQSLFTVPLVNNYKDLDYNPAYTDVYPARIDIQKYLKQGKTGFDIFQASYINQINSRDTLLLMAGHFEQMYSGVHFEFLRESKFLNLSYGLEFSRVYQRNFKKHFLGFKKYNQNIGHINLNYFPNLLDMGISISYGKYLAGDKGITFELEKRFDNGLIMGGFFSKTNLSALQFGEGSFDKGVYVVYPIDIFENERVKGRSSQLYRPLTRDGASKLNLTKRLKNIVHYPGDIFKK